MAKIPVSKYPNQAGYLQFDTDKNSLEVFSDGKIGPVGAVPFDHDINIYVGPGGDFADPYEALDYIQQLQPKAMPINSYNIILPDRIGRTDWFRQYHKINLIFKTGYVFNRPFIIANLYAPWLNLYQEDISIPLESTMEYMPSDTNTMTPTILLHHSSIGHINLNLNYSGTSVQTKYVTAIAAVVSTISELQLRVSNFRLGLNLSFSSTVKRCHEFIANKMAQYGIYSAYNSFILINNTSTFEPLSFTDIGITYSPPYSEAAAMCANTGTIKYYGGPCNISNSRQGFYAIREGKIELHPGANITISNVTDALLSRHFGQFYIYQPLTIGTDVTNITNPTDLTANTFDYRGIIIAPSGITTK